MVETCSNGKAWTVNTNGCATSVMHSKPNMVKFPVLCGVWKECRELFPKGYKLVGADLSGLE